MVFEAGIRMLEAPVSQALFREIIETEYKEMRH
jgi:hypothetical protein